MAKTSSNRTDFNARFYEILRNILGRSLAHSGDHYNTVQCNTYNLYQEHSWHKVHERIEYKIISTTCKVLQSSSPHYLRDIITIQPSRSTRSSSLVTLSFTYKLSRVSKSLTALFGMRHLTYGTNFLHLFAFLVSRPLQSTLLHCQAPTLLLNRWSACLTGSSILVLKLTFSPDPFPP